MTAIMKHPIPKTEKNTRNAFIIDADDELFSFLPSFLLKIINTIKAIAVTASIICADVQAARLFHAEEKSTAFFTEPADADRMPVAPQWIAENKNIENIEVIDKTIFFISDSFVFLIFNLPHISDKINRKIYMDKN